MARDRSSIVKQSRREGYALHPKAHKALVKRSVLPGHNNSARPNTSRGSQYSIQLREKQKVKRLYGLLERQFRKMMNEASRTQGQSGETYRAGLAPSRRAARQLVTHGHFELNGRRIDIPSVRLKDGDKITLRTKSTTSGYFKTLDDISPAPAEIPGWLKVNRKKFEISVNGLPTREDAEADINEQLIVEYYSR